MHTTVKFAKVRPTATIPTKRNEDAGYDIYADIDVDSTIIFPHETVMIPTGIACACDTDYCFILKERGSTGTKGIAQRCGVIDSGYRNEIFVPVTNTTNNIIVLYKKENPLDVIENYADDTNKFIKQNYPGNTSRIDGNTIYYPCTKAIAQLLLIPVPTADIEEYTYEELKAIPSERGSGSLGSSGK